MSAQDALVSERIARQTAVLNGADPDYEAAVPGSAPHGGNRGTVPPTDMYADVGAFLEGGLPDAPFPEVLARADGVRIFYRSQVNLVYGPPESAKTLLAQAACAAEMAAGRSVLFVDLDHNGLEATLSRLLDFGVSEATLSNVQRFRYVEPEDRLHLESVVENVTLHDWHPATAVVDSVGELLPLFGLNSNSPDDFTVAHVKVLKPLAKAGAAVIAIDHLPKNPESQANGPTGTAAKRRAIGGVAIRVSLRTAFVPGVGGSAWLKLNKDRHGNLRRHCGNDDREPLVGEFVIVSTEGEMWPTIRPPEDGDAAKADEVTDDDLASVTALDPPPSSGTDLAARLRWRKQRALKVYRHWRQAGSPSVPGTAEPGEASE